MTKPWVIALWVFTVALAGWLLVDGQRLSAAGVIGTALFWEAIHRVFGNKDTQQRRWVDCGLTAFDF